MKATTPTEYLDMLEKRFGPEEMAIVSTIEEKLKKTPGITGGGKVVIYVGYFFGSPGTLTQQKIIAKYKAAGWKDLQFSDCENEKSFKITLILP